MGFQDQVHEECGVFGVYSPETCDVASTVYYGLFSLQHRGQESCGIIVNDDGIFSGYKDQGLVNDVFSPRVMAGLGSGNMAVGHVRYSTTGESDRSNAQPIVVNHMKGRMALAHNGNLINTHELREELELNGAIFHMTSDTEVISYIIIRERLTSRSIEEAVNCAMGRLKGAYSLVLMSPAKLIAARDPHGFRPLCYGKTADGRYIVASETCALLAVSAEPIRDLDPGEILVIDQNGVRSIRDHCNTAPTTHCVFEYIYFARPDSVIDGISVHEARRKAGEFLAEEYKVDADIVIGVPDSGIDAALGYAKRSGIPYGVGLIKNKYIGRTFIAPGQKSRENLVRIKLNAVPSSVKGKRVIMVDDSIVRGTTSGPIVKLLRDAGATEVHMMVASPPFLNPCYYGTDVDSKENLIACKHTVKEIADIIGVDSLGYLNPKYLPYLAGDGTKGFCTACFDGKYPTEVPAQIRKDKFEQKITGKE